jgi:hypothetical protein
MKIELDNIRAFYAHKYGSIFKGIGIGDKVAKQVVQAWIECKRKLVVIWGSPGSGKSTAIDKLDICDKMIFETTGLNKGINKFLLSLPREQVTFVRHIAPRRVCKHRVRTRTNNPLSAMADDNVQYMLTLVDKWFDKAKQALPVDKETK